MALTAALKAQIAAWYKALQQQIPDFIPRAPQRQMIADVAKTLAGDEGDIWQLKLRPASVKPCPT
ncbi:ATP-dependent DNA helicase DinG [Leclercia adecarboxylata]|uniref:ATP-dependent DNA helicase DinG n=1 Tax=Leclercia adecarboxylata TaxID=83655 RepID=A0A4U9HMV4_9ENTR|nr:ATP-dependent DNA helicase DinG [Leclercia adecarboxylata]